MNIKKTSLLIVFFLSLIFFPLHTVKAAGVCPTANCHLFTTCVLNGWPVDDGLTCSGIDKCCGPVPVVQPCDLTQYGYQGESIDDRVVRCNPAGTALLQCDNGTVRSTNCRCRNSACSSDCDDPIWSSSTLLNGHSKCNITGTILYTCTNGVNVPTTCTCANNACQGLSCPDPVNGPRETLLDGHSICSTTGTTIYTCTNGVIVPMSCRCVNNACQRSSSSAPTSNGCDPNFIEGGVQKSCSNWDFDPNGCVNHGQFSGKPSCNYCTTSNRCVCGTCASGTCEWCGEAISPGVGYTRDPGHDTLCSSGKVCWKTPGGTQCGNCKKSNPFQSYPGEWHGGVPIGPSQCSDVPIPNHYRYLHDRVMDANCEERMSQDCKDNAGHFNCNDICCGEQWPSSSSSSSPSSSPLPPDTVAPTPITNIIALYNPVNNAIFFSWSWAGDGTCAGCEAKVGRCLSTGISSGDTKISCDPVTKSPFWWQVINETTGNAMISKPAYYYNGNYKTAGLSWVPSDSTDQTYSYSCQENLDKKHDVMRIDIDIRDARGNIVGQQGAAWPNVRSSKTTCCKNLDKGNANCDDAVSSADYTIWECEYVNANGIPCSVEGDVSNKWSDFDMNKIVTLKDFEIWRENQQ